MPLESIPSSLLYNDNSFFILTPHDLQILRRGRNAVGRRRKSDDCYQDATALETLVGYLYLTDLQRCQELLEWIRGEIYQTKQTDKER